MEWKGGTFDHKYDVAIVIDGNTLQVLREMSMVCLTIKGVQNGMGGVGKKIKFIQNRISMKWLGKQMPNYK